MAWTDDYAHVPGVPNEHRGDPVYEKDYWVTYEDTWKVAWSCACRDSRARSLDAIAWTQQRAHMMAVDFANVKRKLRH
jgi:hypothetical protein